MLKGTHRARRTAQNWAHACALEERASHPVRSHVEALFFCVGQANEKGESTIQYTPTRGDPDGTDWRTYVPRTIQIAVAAMGKETPQHLDNQTVRGRVR